MHITKNSVVALTLKPVTVIHLTDEELDILALLKVQPKRMTVEGLGMDLKDPYIVNHVQSLYNKGLVAAVDLTLWTCPVCGSPNTSQVSDPRRVKCSKCRNVLAVTGRNIDGSLLVRHFKVR